MRRYDLPGIPAAVLPVPSAHDAHPTAAACPPGALPVEMAYG